MSNFENPHFYFGYQYAVVMSVDDAYYRKMYGSNDYFSHWFPSNSTSTSPAHQNYVPVRPNFHPSNNYSTIAFMKNRQPFRKAASTSDQVMSAVRNGPKVQTSTYIKPPKYGNKKQEVVINSDVYQKPNDVFFNGQVSQLAASMSQVFINGQSVHNQGYGVEKHYRSSFAAKSANLVPSPVSNCVSPVSSSTPLDRNVYRYCSFCRQNGDRPEFYESHPLKDSSGNVVCPVLRAYVCEICKATGSQAHTRTYCPVLKSAAQKPLKSAVCLKNTLRNSSGCIRRQFLN